MRRARVFAMVMVLLLADRALAQQPVSQTPVAAALDQARTARRQGQLDSAIRQLEGLLEKNPDHYLATYNLALAYADKKDYPAALRQFSRASDLQRQQGIRDATLYNSIGWTRYLASDLAGAEESYMMAVQGQESLSRLSRQKLYNNLGVLYMSKRDYANAERYFKLAAEQYGSSLARDNLERMEAVRQSSGARHQF